MITQIELFYKERMDPNSFWESMTDFNYQIRITWNNSLEEFETNIVEKYPYDTDTDDESEDIVEKKDIEDLILKSLKTEELSAFKTKTGSEHDEEDKANETYYKQYHDKIILEMPFCEAIMACDDKLKTPHKNIHNDPYCDTFDIKLQSTCNFQKQTIENINDHETLDE